MNMAGNLDICLSVVCYLMYVRCISRFLKIHLQGKRREQEVFSVLFFFGCGMMKIWMKGKDVPYILSVACIHVFLCLLTMTVFGGEKEKRLFAAVAVAAMTELIWNFCESLFTCGALLLVHAAEGGGSMAAIGKQSGRVLLVMTYGTGIAVINRLSSPLHSVFTDKRKSWYLCGAVPLGCIIFVMDIVNWAASNGIMVQDWGKFGLYENQLFSHGAICIVTGLSMAAAGFFVFGMEKIDRKERAGEQYRCQVAYYEMMEEQYGRMERLRHDMKNHMLVLENLVQNKSWEQAGDYLRELAEAGSIKAEDEVTGSLVLDALLYHKRKEALAENIRWQCDVRVPKDCPVKGTDLCIIVGNILDNALEACLRLRKAEEPFIKVYMETIKKCLFLEVQNSMNADERQEDGGSLKRGRSQKENPWEHGLGLGNMKAAAAKYNGAVHMEAENGIFTISVLLPLLM